MSAQYEVRGRTAVIALDFPPVNGIGSALRKELHALFSRAIADEAVRAVVITGTHKAFSAGADVKEFGTEAATRSPRLAELITAFEESPKPVIAAISGVCMGGGLELALGAHYRVARSDARIALPEVKLGLMPGAGGTQRLPRAIGVQRALEVIVSGESFPAAHFRDTGLFTVVTDKDPVAVAVDLAETAVASGQSHPRLRDVHVSDHGAAEAVRAAREKVAATARGLPAPAQCVEAVAWCLDVPFDTALQKEREAFAGLMRSPEARALRHAFAAERAVGKVEGVPEDCALRPVRRAGVVGAGTMGSGIVMALLNAGLSVVLVETSQAALDRGRTTIAGNYEASVKRGKLSPEQVAERMAKLTTTLDFASLAEVDLVIEAVFEDLAVKEGVFRTLDQVCKPGAVLASNTSYLDIDRIAAFTRRPQDVLGLHFFSPAHVMRLLEVVRGARTAPDVLATCMALARTLGKIGVVAGVCDGFIGNRMGFRYTSAAFGLVAAGATPQQVDTALQAFGMAMGPLRMGDLAGLDISWAARKRRAAESGGSPRPVVPDVLCEAGRFGQKTGAGWYRYEKGQREPLHDPETDRLIAQFRATQGITPRAVSDQEIVERCIFALVNEGARILEERIAARASDIDVVYLHGYGFPRHRGGPMLYADMVGLPNVLNVLRRFASEGGADGSWRPAPLLERLAHEGKAFN